MQNDYIMRMIEQFVQTIASIIRSRKAGYTEQALAQIQSGSQRFLNEDISSLLKYTPNQLVEHFKDNSRFLDTERSIICADLLHELAWICKEKQSLNASLHLMAMSLNLYISVIPIDKQFQTQEYIRKADDLIKEIKEIHKKQFSEEIQANLNLYQNFLRETMHIS